MFRELFSANIWWIIAAVSIYFVEVGLWTGRWWSALRAIGEKINFLSLYWICHGGKFVTNITPIVKAGGDPFRAYFAKKTEDLRYRIGLGTLMAESAIGVPVFLGFLGTGLVIWLYMSSAIFFSVITAILFSLGIIFFIPIVRWLVKRETASDTLIGIITWFSDKLNLDQGEEKVENALKEFYTNIEFVMSHKKAGILMVLFSIALYITTIIRFDIIFLALGMQVPIYIPLLAATLPFILGLIPFSPGGLVFIEGGMIALLGVFAIPNDIAGSFIIIERSISYLISTIAGGIAASYLGIKVWKSKQ